MLVEIVSTILYFVCKWRDMVGMADPCTHS